MVSGPLDGIEGRLDWARKNLDELETDIGLFLKEPLYEVVPEAQPNGRTYLFRAHQLRPIPTDFGYQVGDCIHNFRAVLDNIAFALVSAHRKPSGGLAFPICRNSLQFRDKALPGLTGIPQPAIDILEALQPYNTPDRQEHVLYQLNRRWNRDKHRTPTLVGAIPSDMSYISTDDPITGYELFAGEGIKDGVIVGYITYQSADHTARKPNFAFEIAVEEPRRGQVWGVIEILKASDWFIRYMVLEKLRPYF